MDMNLSKLQEIVEIRGAWLLQSVELQRLGHSLVIQQHLWQELLTHEYQT